MLMGSACQVLDGHIDHDIAVRLHTYSKDYTYAYYENTYMLMDYGRYNECALNIGHTHQHPFVLTGRAITNVLV